MRIVMVLLLAFTTALLAAPQIVNSFDAPDSGVNGLAYAGGSLYALSGNTVYKLDPATGATQNSFSITATNSNGIGYAGALLYITNGTSNVYKYTLTGTYSGVTSLYCAS
ncbi:MAG: hypothetical protein KAH54_12280 [Candidatus Sabulitectum sp.]|nr:hypothetical protein [Candidatus Sabulitectum sp.]